MERRVDKMAATLQKLTHDPITAQAKEAEIASLQLQLRNEILQLAEIRHRIVGEIEQMNGLYDCAVLYGFLFGEKRDTVAENLRRSIAHMAALGGQALDRFYEKYRDSVEVFCERLESDQ